MSKPKNNDDFFEPSLDARHDVKFVQVPWNPASIVWSSFIVGPAGAAILIFLNDEKLKVRSKRWLLLVALSVFATLPMISVELGFEEFTTEDRRNWRPLISLLSVGGAYFATGPQRLRFRIFEAEDGEPNGMFQAGFLAFLAGLALFFGTAYAIKALAAVFG